MNRLAAGTFGLMTWTAASRGLHELAPTPMTLDWAYGIHFGSAWIGLVGALALYHLLTKGPSA